MKYDMILFMGQSNMQGQTECLPEVNDAVQGTLEYRYLTNSLLPLRHPVGENILYSGGEGFSGNDVRAWVEAHALGGAAFGNACMIPDFCRAYVEKTGRSVLAVPVAKGSTCVGDWLEGAPCFEMLYRKVCGALEKMRTEGMTVGSVYAVWLQGESDALARTTTKQYKDRLTELKNMLKREFDLSRFGIIKVGAFAGDERDEAIFRAQEEICSEDGDFVMLTRITAQLVLDSRYMNPHWRGHYNTAGQALLGRTAGAALGEVVMSGESF